MLTPDVPLQIDDWGAEATWRAGCVWLVKQTHDQFSWPQLQHLTTCVLEKKGAIGGVISYIIDEALAEAYWP